MENEKLCWKCNYFMNDKKDFDTGFGVCMYDNDKFEDYLDEIYENEDFSSCMQAYDESRISGDDCACENYEEIEGLDIEDDSSNDEFDVELFLQTVQNQSIDDFKKHLYLDDFDNKEKAVYGLIRLSNYGNKMAFKELINYLKTSEPPKIINEVHLRLKILDMLTYEHRHEFKKEEVVDLFIEVLLKTPSNNTSRQIYTMIFRYLERCTNEIVKEPLLRYLEISGCSNKIKKKVENIVWGEDIEDIGGIFYFSTKF